MQLVVHCHQVTCRLLCQKMISKTLIMEALCLEASERYNIQGILEFLLVANLLYILDCG